MATRDKRLAQFNLDSFPPADTAVQILCEDKSGTYIPPFNCFYRSGEWISEKTGTAMQVAVVGWKAPIGAFRRKDG